MLSKDINGLIATAMKNKDTNRVATLRLIKNEFVKAEKDGKVLDDALELKILNKMVLERNDDIEQYTLGGRQDLAEAERVERDIIKEFIPAEPSEEEVVAYINDVIDNLNVSDLSMKYMKQILGEVNKKYPTVNGKIVSGVLNNRVKK